MKNWGKLIFYHAPSNNIGAGGLWIFDIRAKVNTGESFVSRFHTLSFSSPCAVLLLHDVFEEVLTYFDESSVKLCCFQIS